jgi:hypothetical protein
MFSAFLSSSQLILFIFVFFYYNSFIFAHFAFESQSEIWDSKWADQAQYNIVIFSKFERLLISLLEIKNKNKEILFKHFNEYLNTFFEYLNTIFDYLNTFSNTKRFLNETAVLVFSLLYLNIKFELFDKLNKCISTSLKLRNSNDF